MNKSAQINLAQIIYQSTSAKTEKRRHFRLSLRLPMEYSFLEAPSRFRLAYTADISEGGLSMYTPEKLDIGRNVSLKFFYGSAAGIDSIQARGEVIRADRSGKSEGEYRCAVRFSDLPPDFLKKLRIFLATLY